MEDLTIQWMDQISMYPNDYDRIIDINMTYLDKLGASKTESGLGYLILKSLVTNYTRKKQYIIAFQWAELFDTFDFVKAGRIDSGEKDYYLGIANYNIGNSEKAKSYFTIAIKKSKGRCFQLLFGDEYRKIYDSLSK